MSSSENAYGRHHRPRVLVAKVGLDGHDRGAKLVAMALRDAGYEVIYAGIRQTPESVAAIAVSEDVELVGLSILSGAHSVLVPDVIDHLRRAGVDAVVVLGGIIPVGDRAALIEGGVALIFEPGDSMERITKELDALLEFQAISRLRPLPHDNQ